MTEILATINARLDNLERATLLGAKPILDIEEAAMYTGYSVRGIYTLTSHKEIPHYKRNGKLYFKKLELEAWMTEHRIATNREINSAAATYTATHKYNKK
jgi:excisionase family DNA binding protein